jgi:hypothetical protein
VTLVLGGQVGNVIVHLFEFGNSFVSTLPYVQILRTVAMWQCGAHFSHLIIHEKHDTHELVTSGVYR